MVDPGAVQTALWQVPALISLMLALSVAAEPRKCYMPSATEAVDDVPCTSDATTWCCNKNDICLSNGLCFMQRDTGLAIARGSCTDRSWSSCGEYKYCVDGAETHAITASPYNGSNTVHCCGASTYNTTDHSTSCQHWRVQIPRGTAMPGVAALAADFLNYTSSNSSESSDSKSSHDVVIGVGTGVPLGIIALVSLAWAFWERRGRIKALAQMRSQQTTSNVKQPPTTGTAQLPGSSTDTAQLPGSFIGPAQLPGSLTPAAQLPGQDARVYSSREIQEIQSRSPREVDGSTVVCELEGKMRPQSNA